MSGESFITATGGTITTSGNYKIHTFTGPGTFCVTVTVGSCAAKTLVSYVVAGGGGGGASVMKVVYSRWEQALVVTENSKVLLQDPYTGSPLDGNPSAGNRITVSVQAYPIHSRWELEDQLVSLCS